MKCPELKNKKGYAPPCLGQRVLFPIVPLEYWHLHLVTLWVQEGISVVNSMVICLHATNPKTELQFPPKGDNFTVMKIWAGHWRGNTLCSGLQPADSVQLKQQECAGNQAVSIRFFGSSLVGFPAEISKLLPRIINARWSKGNNLQIHSQV